MWLLKADRQAWYMTPVFLISALQMSKQQKMKVQGNLKQDKITNGQNCMQLQRCNASKTGWCSNYISLPRLRKTPVPSVRHWRHMRCWYGLVTSARVHCHLPSLISCVELSGISSYCSPSWILSFGRNSSNIVTKVKHNSPTISSQQLCTWRWLNRIDMQRAVTDML